MKVSIHITKNFLMKKFWDVNNKTLTVKSSPISKRALNEFEAILQKPEIKV
jgi:hypothetical protein